MPGRPDDDVTVGPSVPLTRAVTTPATHPPSSVSSRFAPGSIIAGRYRLIGLLGRGGMGEVYRADDLTLDHPVALKFLPEQVAADSTHLALFHNELRIARQVSHKNVCRLYDLGEADGRRFLTMEYIDGEDLASLLRRIGRIPEDKAIELARQLCAGLAAAHERGVLHRDLKPANVMIDGEGNVRITDFGLAVAAGQTDAGRAGTPQYMAPEQLTGAAIGSHATVKTDLYALGLVLFEIFTGKRAYEAKTLADLIRQHESGSMTTPTSVVRDLDPAIERIILRCLERDPARRPASALAVAAALPGANPLAEALAAGETPSPDLLVAAGEAEAMPVAQALACFVAFAAVLITVASLAPRAAIVGLVPMEKPPDVLADRAEQVISAMGYSEPAVDKARGFAIPPDYPRWAQRTGPPDWWPALRLGSPPSLLFWYRTSPRDLVPSQPASSLSPTDPPMILSGMRLVILDTRGRLVEFHSVPPQQDAETSAPRSLDWKPLFDSAGLEYPAFRPSPPQWTPPHFADTRAAWEGPLVDRPDLTVRIEAAAYRGQPMSFYVVGPWSRASRMTPVARTTGQRLTSAINVAFAVLILGGAALLARYNLRANRADRRGAARLAIGLTMLGIVAWAFGAHHVSSAEVEINQVIQAISFASFLGLTVWVMYLAVEPYARRFWPDGLLGWTRLLSGHVRDPRVGRDLLIGCVLGAALMTMETAQALLPQRWGYKAPLPPFGNAVSTLASSAFVVTRWVSTLYGAMQSALVIGLIFVIIRMLVRRGWLAAVTGAAILSALTNGGQAFTGNWFDTALIVAISTMMTFAVYRFGLLALAVAMFTDNIASGVPLTLRASAWWATPSNLSIALLLALAAFAFHAARAGQPLFGNLTSESLKSEV